MSFGRSCGSEELGVVGPAEGCGGPVVGRDEHGDLSDQPGWVTPCPARPVWYASAPMIIPTPLMARGMRVRSAVRVEPLRSPVGGDRPGLSAFELREVAVVVCQLAIRGRSEVVGPERGPVLLKTAEVVREHGTGNPPNVLRWGSARSKSRRDRAISSSISNCSRSCSVRSVCRASLSWSRAWPVGRGPRQPDHVVQHRDRVPRRRRRGAAHAGIGRARHSGLSCSGTAPIVAAPILGHSDRLLVADPRHITPDGDAQRDNWAQDRAQADWRSWSAPRRGWLCRRGRAQHRRGRRTGRRWRAGPSGTGPCGSCRRQRHGRCGSSRSQALVVPPGLGGERCWRSTRRSCPGRVGSAAGSWCRSPWLRGRY